MTQRLFTKNFTLLVLGQASSLFGNFMLRLALSMYVLDETGSAAIFAGILSVSAIPSILLSPLGGILADRANRRNIMVALDALTGISVLAAVLLLSPSNAIAVIGTLLIVLSVFGAFETPTVQACIPQMLTDGNIVKGNVVVNQVASAAYFVAPFLGGVLYAAVGVKPVMAASVFCFLVTAFFECFIKLDCPQTSTGEGFLQVIKDDFKASIRFLRRDQPDILKMLLFAALASFFVMGTATVGLPYLVRNILGLSAAHYGAAESLVAVSAILGSIAAGVLAEKMKIRRMALFLFALGAFLLPAGAAFLLPLSTGARYGINIAAFCGMQAAVTLFSIFALSYIQQKTPSHLIGKVMAFTSAITMCVQPFGQAIYGFLFDCFRNAVPLVLIPTGAAVCVIGLSARSFFKRLEG